MGNTSRKENNSSKGSQTLLQTLVKPFIRPPRKIKRGFKQWRAFYISLPSNTRKLVKKGSKFYNIMLNCIRRRPDKTKDTLNAFVAAFKERKLPSQVLSLYLNGNDEDLKKLAMTLHSQRNVSALTLHFIEDSELTKQAIKFLILKLSRMYLSKLEISFSFRRSSAEHFSLLFSGLKNLTWLSNLTLDLPYLKCVKLPAIKNLVSSLKVMRRLERLRFSVKDSLIKKKPLKSYYLA